MAETHRNRRSDSAFRNSLPKYIKQYNTDGYSQVQPEQIYKVYSETPTNKLQSLFEFATKSLMTNNFTAEYRWAFSLSFAKLYLSARYLYVSLRLLRFLCGLTFFKIVFWWISNFSERTHIKNYFSYHIWCLKHK